MSVDLPAPFGPMRGDHLPTVHVQIDVVQRGLAAEFDGEMFDFQAAGVFAVAAVRVFEWYHPNASFMVSIFWVMAER